MSKNTILQILNLSTYNKDIQFVCWAMNNKIIRVPDDKSHHELNVSYGRISGFLYVRQKNEELLAPVCYTSLVVTHIYLVYAQLSRRTISFSVAVVRYFPLTVSTSGSGAANAIE